MPERVLEFASYQAMIACVAAGTGYADRAEIGPGGTARNAKHPPAPAAEALFAQPHAPRVERRTFAGPARPHVGFVQHRQMMPGGAPPAHHACPADRTQTVY